MMEEHHSKKLKVANKKTKLIRNGYVFQHDDIVTKLLQLMARTIIILETQTATSEKKIGCGFRASGFQNSY